MTSSLLHSIETTCPDPAEEPYTVCSRLKTTTNKHLFSADMLIVVTVISVYCFTSVQRKEYSEKLNKHSDNFRYRVEHLFTCELDGKEVKSVVDCMVKLKKVDAKGRVWPQEMIMEAQGGYLILNDIETKSELEAMPFGSILQSKAVLNSGVYNSVLTLTVQERSKRNHQVYMFQCEETGVSYISREPSLIS
uniref:PTB domain-containing protein n=1 Tax=Stegastes partitus TaxID=144197 RepID=A0A3B4ZBD5_9TELE